MPGRKKSPDHRAFDLSENNSHSAASIARAPDSHCCQFRCVRCTRAEASAVESLADSRACRISAGDGLLLFTSGQRVNRRNGAGGVIAGERIEPFGRSFGIGELAGRKALSVDDIFNAHGAGVVQGQVQRMDMGLAEELNELAHDFLRLFGLRCATHDFTIASEQRSRKSYFASNENNFGFGGLGDG